MESWFPEISKLGVVRVGFYLTQITFPNRTTSWTDLLKSSISDDRAFGERAYYSSATQTQGEEVATH